MRPRGGAQTPFPNLPPCPGTILRLVRNLEWMVVSDVNECVLPMRQCEFLNKPLDCFDLSIFDRFKSVKDKTNRVVIGPRKGLAHLVYGCSNSVQHGGSVVIKRHRSCSTFQEVAAVARKNCRDANVAVAATESRCLLVVTSQPDYKLMSDFLVCRE